MIQPIKWNRETRKFTESPEYTGIVFTCAWKFNEPKSTKSTVIESKNFDSWLSSQRAKYDYFTLDHKEKGYDKDKLKEKIDPIKDSFSKLNTTMKFSVSDKFEKECKELIKKINPKADQKEIDAVYRFGLGLAATPRDLLDSLKEAVANKVKI